MTTQKKAVAVFSLLALALLLLYTVPIWSTPAKAARKGNRLWGTWYVTFISQLGVTIPAIITFNRDGTFASSDGTDFGGEMFPRQNSPLRGVWVRTGPLTFEASGFYFGGDSETGLTTILSIFGIIEFGDDFDHINGTFFQDLFECPTPVTCPDPLTAEPDRTLQPSEFQGRRLRVEPPDYGNDDYDN